MAGDGDATNRDEATTSRGNLEVERSSIGEGNTEDDRSRTIPFHKLFAYADRKDKLLMIIGTIGAIGNGLCEPLMSILFGDMVTAFGDTQTNNDIVKVVSKVALKFVYLAIGAGFASFLQVTCWMVTGERQSARIRGLYLKTILRQDSAFFDMETNTGEVIGTMFGDIVLIEDAMGEKVGKCIELFVTFIAGFVIAFIQGWLLALVMLTSVPFLVISGIVMYVTGLKMESGERNSHAKAATVVEHTIGAIRTVASFTGEKQAIIEYNKHLVSADKWKVYKDLTDGFVNGVGMFVVFGTYALAVWYGGKMILDKKYDGGKVVNLSEAIFSALKSIVEASHCLRSFPAGQIAAYEIFETIKRKPEIDAYDTIGKVLENIRGDIELKDVHFTYPSRPEQKIFHGFSIFIPSGTTAALVGQSGSGRSTVISLIERFYDPQAGQVLIDGINLKEFQLKWIREKIGLVSQEPALFIASIRENIAYGNSRATKEDIRAAIEMANAAEFIDKLPQGLDTMVAEHGTQLSGGEKQRIAIARAILKDPRIMLLDEATSALDAESEKMVQEALERIMVNRTTVIVAHHLTSVRNADMIAVIYQGKVVQKGSHSKLLNDPEGAYSQLIRLQEGNKESEADRHRRLDFSSGSLRRSSQRMSFTRSISRAASRGSSHPSFSISFGLPTASTVTNAALEALEEAPPPYQRAPDVPLRRLVALNKPKIPVLFLGAIVAAVNGVVMPISGMLVSKVVDTYYETPNKLKKGSSLWALIFLALGFTSFLAHPSMNYLFTVVGVRLIQRIRALCFEKIVHMEVGWFDLSENSSGAISARLSVGVVSLRALVGDALSQMVQNAAGAIVGLVIAFTASWQLSLIILAPCLLLGFNGYVRVKFMKCFNKDAEQMYEKAKQVANDAVKSIRTIASFCSKEEVMQLYERKCKGLRKMGIKKGLVNGIGFGLSSFLVFNIYAIGSYAGALFVEADMITFSAVFQVFLPLVMMAEVVSQSSSMSIDFTKAKNVAASIFSMIDRKSLIDSADESGTTLDSVKGEIKLLNISFRYPAGPDIHILRDLCLNICPGQTVALVGESGSGKSTIIALLQRFYDPELGRITLDGIELQKLNLRWLRQQIGLVSQEPSLFNNTIRANIAYGKQGNANEEEILEAAKLSNASEFICLLNQGYDTMVGERGVQMSRGQKQRIAIARAIVKDPKILLLDETTGALDAESERVVQDALDRVMVNRTTVVVTHRLSTIKNADVIAVLKNGVIVEEGSHEKLMAIEDGAYASLVALHTSLST